MPSTRRATTTPPRPTSRYGTDPESQRPSGVAGKVIAVVAIVLVALMVVFLGRYVIQRNSQPISGTLVSHERIDDTTSRVWFDVERDDTSVPSYCIITSLNYERAEIGRRDVVVPPGGDTHTRMHVDIPTRDVPVSGGVYGCSTTFPSYLDPESDFLDAR